MDWRLKWNSDYRFSKTFDTVKENLPYANIAMAIKIDELFNQSYYCTCINSKCSVGNYV